MKIEDDRCIAVRKLTLGMGASLHCFGCVRPYKFVSGNIASLHRRLKSRVPVSRIGRHLRLRVGGLLAQS